MFWALDMHCNFLLTGRHGALGVRNCCKQAFSDMMVRCGVTGMQSCGEPSAGSFTSGPQSPALSHGTLGGPRAEVGCFPSPAGEALVFPEDRPYRKKRVLSYSTFSSLLAALHCENLVELQKVTLSNSYTALTSYSF